MTQKTITYPSYYELDDIPCVVFINKSGVDTAVNDFGNPKNALEVMSEGAMITRKEFEKLAKARDTKLKGEGVYQKTLEMVDSSEAHTVSL